MVAGFPFNPQTSITVPRHPLTTPHDMPTARAFATHATSPLVNHRILSKTSRPKEGGRTLFGLKPTSTRRNPSFNRDGPSAGLLGLQTRSNHVRVPRPVSSSQNQPMRAHDANEGLKPFINPYLAASLSM